MLSAVVLDTNVFVAAGFNPRSVSARIVDAAAFQAIGELFRPGDHEARLSTAPPDKAPRVL